MVMSPQVSWLFFKARAKCPYLIHTGRASNAEKQPTGRGPKGCVENGPAAALLVGYVSIQICALLAPCRRPILNATTSPLYARRYTRYRRRFRPCRESDRRFVVVLFSSLHHSVLLITHENQRNERSAVSLVAQ